MKKVLMLASVASMIGQFNISNIEILQEIGYQVDVACNFKTGSTCSDETITELKRRLREMSIRCYQIDFSRRVTDVVSNMKALWQVEYLLAENQYEFIHCHSPIGGVVARIAGKIKHTKVIYTAHGFHFFNGAPMKNWMFYYPIEKFLSRWTDTIITINHEDYNRAKKEFHAKNVEYIPGVGVNTSRFRGCAITKSEKRKELGISEDAFVLLSVGEFSSKKNRQVVIKAVEEIADSSIYYVIAGQGEDYDNYKKLAKDVGIEEQLILLEARTDVDELCVAADVFVHPSICEGLGIVSLEGMAAGLPLIFSYVNGIKDYIEDGVSGVCVKDPLDVEEMKNAILRMLNDEELRTSCAANNRKKVEIFSLAASRKVMNEIYEKICEGGYSDLLRSLKRAEIGARYTDFVLISVGEVNENKNHRAIIEALHIIEDRNIKYYVIGMGELREALQKLVNEYGMNNQVFFLGYRGDIPQLLKAADVFCFPSKREGLGLAAVEAMASGLPLLTSNVHGINDYSVHGVTGYSCSPDNYVAFAQMIVRMKNDHENRKAFGWKNAANAVSYDITEVNRRMREIYNRC